MLRPLETGPVGIIFKTVAVVPKIMYLKKPERPDPRNGMCARVILSLNANLSVWTVNCGSVLIGKELSLLGS